MVNLQERFLSLAGKHSFRFMLLFCALLSAAIWIIFPETGVWALLVGIAPRSIRLLAGRFPIRRTPFDIPIFILLFTAGISVWTAYDPQAAWGKFWLLVGAVLIYYALIEQSVENIWPVVMSLSIIGAAILVLWLGLHITSHSSQLEGDTVAGILIITLPPLIAWGIHHWHQKRFLTRVVFILLCSLYAIGVLVTKEHGVWLGLMLSSVFVFVGIMLYFRRKRMGAGWLRRDTIVAIALICIAGIFITLITLQFSDAIQARIISTGRIPTLENIIYLAAEFPLLGGGLASFPGLYSRYMLGIHYLFLEHGHNLYLNVALEQGWFGLLATLWILVISVWVLWHAVRKNQIFYPGQKLLLTALLFSFLLRVIHDLTEDSLYSSIGAAWLLMLPGLTLMSTRYRRLKALPWRNISLQQVIATVSIIIVILLTMIVVAQSSLKAIYYANLGAVQMARIQLANWPQEKTESKELLAAIAPAEASLQHSLQYGSETSAYYRLGLIAMERRDFTTACNQLEEARRGNPNHRGVIKALGYAYAWTGQLELAAELLAQIPEAKKELNAYTNWWKEENRSDLSIFASKLAEMLK